MRNLRTALLLLLSEGDSHGYDLAPRLAEVGMPPDMGAMYRTLRTMDRDGEVRSTWDVSPHGPARRVYALTDKGRRRLAPALDRLEAQRRTIGALLGRSQRLALVRVR